MSIDDILSSFPSGILAERTLSFQYNSNNRLLFLFLQVLFFCGHQLGDYFLNQVTRTKILVAIEPKVDATWRVVLGLYKRIITMDQTCKIGDLIAHFLFLCAV